MYNGKRVAVLIAAAGTGERMNSALPKQFLSIEGKTLLEKSTEAFENNASVDDIYIVTGSRYVNLIKKESCQKIRKVIEGGSTRQESVHAGLEQIEKNTDIVLIHDAVRPYVSKEQIDRIIEAACHKGAVIPAVPVSDTVKIVDGEKIINTPDRATLYSAQTPQGFEFTLIREAHKNAAEKGIVSTDDAMLIEGTDHPVYIISGDVKNTKITYADDLHDKESLVGLGFDVHEFVDDRDLIIGGTELPYERGLKGHSDADVLTHALMDAILGALDLGDIGTNFPDTDMQYKDIKSTILLKKVHGMMTQKGYTLGNADLIIVAEKPKMQEYIPAMKKNLAEVLRTADADRISIKATTTEGLGFTGREEGIGAQAIVQLIKINQ